MAEQAQYPQRYGEQRQPAAEQEKRTETQAQQGRDHQGFAFVDNLHRNSNQIRMRRRERPASDRLSQG